MNEISHVLIAYANNAGTYIYTVEEACRILNDYCRAKIDAKNIEAGQPLWVEKAQRCIHEWVYDPFEDMDVCQRCNLQMAQTIVNDPTRNVAETAQERRP